MKRFLLFLAASLPAFGALGAGVSWDIRTTGSNSNGGGFDTASAGTDQSQANTAAVTINNSTVTATCNASTITFTGATYVPTSADVGNLVHIVTSTGGTGATAGWYEIGSQTPTTWVLDRTTGAIATTLTSALMGGSLLTIQQGFTSGVADRKSTR